MRTRIVVPCYNEEGRFTPSAFEAYLADCNDVGFVFVNDGSSDRTPQLLRELAQRWPDRVCVIDQGQNRGKAEAVRAGVLAALRTPLDCIGYLDADLATPLEAIAELRAVLERDPRIEIVMGARVALLGRRIERSRVRHYAGRIFATAASTVLGLTVYDTQCGAKLMRASPRVRALFEAPFGSRWIFDVELLARYLVAGGSAEGIYELPLKHWSDVGESHLRMRDFVRAAGEIAAIGRDYEIPGAPLGVLRSLRARTHKQVDSGAVKPPSTRSRGRR